ncbi:MAG: hypothetical protein NTW89_05035 [Burkholderiales bacterium]|nr:hypothetical protein [Burkholderiales bacterium]
MRFRFRVDSTNAEQNRSSSLTISLMGMFGAGLAVAVLWTCLFYANDWLFSNLSVSKVIHWIFLPAAIRMLAVMALGWVGAIGLFVGALLTNDMVLHSSWEDAIAIAALSAVGPLAAVRFCTQWLGLEEDFAGLRPTQLITFAVAGAICNVVPHNVYFFFSGHSPDILSGMLPMLVGDLLGTLVVLYLASLALKLLTLKRLTSRS